jgi:hypothetical protein
MSAHKLKRLLGDGGAGLDDSHGPNRLLVVLQAMVETMDAIIESHNALLADYNAETHASHVTSSATAVTNSVSVE